MAEYLGRADDDPKNFVLKDLTLDKYLKAQSAFDAELAATLESPDFDPSRQGSDLAHLLAARYDVNASLERGIDQARSGRGMAALDALIMLEQTRLRAAQWSERPPMEIDRVAEALQNLRDMRARWADKTKDAGLSPVYALTRLDAKGERTWTVDQWLTPEEVAARKDVQRRDGRLFVEDDVVADPAHPERMIRVDPSDPLYPRHMRMRYELVGGVDAAQAELTAAKLGLDANNSAIDLSDRMKKSDFVAVGGRDEKGDRLPSDGLAFDQVFVGDDSKYAQGRLFFFDAKADPAGAQKQLTPLAALSLPPDQIVIKYFVGPVPPPHDRFPTLRSVYGSDEAAGFRTLAVSPSGAAALADHARRFEHAQERRGWIEVKLNSYAFARDENGRVVQLYGTKDDYSAQWKAFVHAPDDLATAKDALTQAQGEEARRKADADAAQKAYDDAMRDFNKVRDSGDALKALKSEQDAADAIKRSGTPTGGEKADFDVKVRAYQAILDASPAKKAFDKAAKIQKDALQKYHDAQAKTVNAGQAVKEQAAILDHSRKWTLYLAGDLALSIDHDKDVVHVAAAAQRPTAASPSLRLDEDVAGGGPADATLTGGLSAAVVDADGRLVNAYATGADVDAAATGWKLMSITPKGDVDARLPGQPVRTKVRISHYEEQDDVNGVQEHLPVLLSERYLIDRLDATKSRLSTAGHWAIMPYNWGSIVLEIPREIAQAPAELISGRDLNSSHYLGRVQMYKTEGGETEHHGFFRQTLGWVDVLNLLPDPVARYYDPSQFPDAVSTDSPLKPGQILADKTPRDRRGGKTYDVKFGVGSMTRQVGEAAEDLDAARQRTLARFNGGVEELTVEAVRGRAGDYQESTLKVHSGDVKGADAKPVSAIDQRLGTDAALAADPAANGSRDFTATATPGALFVDRVSRRVTVYPGAAGYERQARAMDGYGDRVAAGDRTARDAHQGLLDASKKAGDTLGDRTRERDKALKDEQDTWNAFHKLAERKGIQDELERRIAVLQSEIKDLKAELAWWTNYAAQLEAARRGDIPGAPGQPGQPGTPGWPGSPMFWAWMLALFGLGALLAALYHGLLRHPLFH